MWHVLAGGCYPTGRTSPVSSSVLRLDRMRGQPCEMFGRMALPGCSWAADVDASITSHRNLREHGRTRASVAAGPWRLGGDPGRHAWAETRAVAAGR